MQTPVGQAQGVKLAGPVPMVVPVLRAGVGMLDGMIRLLPNADVGFVGLARDEETLLPTTYAGQAARRASRPRSLVLDPMLATGGTLQAAIELLAVRGAGGRHGGLPARGPRRASPGWSGAGRRQRGSPVRS